MDAFLLILCLLFVLFMPVSVVALEAPPLMLAKSYQQGINVADYYVSEKLDGVRAYWNGRQLLTRSGRVIKAPAWFLAVLPARPLDGELWMGRGRFSEVSGIVNRRQPRDQDWQQVTYMLFDLPDMEVPYTERLWVLRTLAAQYGSAHVKVLEQTRISNDKELNERLTRVTAAGGEGLMLRRARSLYQVSRSDDLLKVKLTLDDEAKVIGYVAGEGKYRGALGALIVRMEDGRQFRLGSGFSDEERLHPPAIGESVTFAYSGLTEHGLPRFARFLRVRPPE